MTTTDLDELTKAIALMRAAGMNKLPIRLELIEQMIAVVRRMERGRR